MTVFAPYMRYSFSELLQFFPFPSLLLSFIAVFFSFRIPLDFQIFRCGIALFCPNPFQSLLFPHLDRIVYIALSQFGGEWLRPDRLTARWRAQDVGWPGKKSDTTRNWQLPIANGRLNRRPVLPVFSRGAGQGVTKARWSDGASAAEGRETCGLAKWRACRLTSHEAKAFQATTRVEA
jgi:hypothetical protein